MNPSVATTPDYAERTLDILAGLLGGMGGGPLMVHTDLLPVRRLVPPQAGLDGHVAALRRLAADRPLWVAAFDDDWPHTRYFDVRATPTTVGVLNEHMRLQHAEWRTVVPLVSFCGVGASPRADTADLLDPFGDDSAFAQLAAADGSIIHYGSDFAATTFIHHVEHIAGRPAYRYDKKFPGVIILPDGSERRLTLLYHCRPRGRHFDYDWRRLEADAVAAGVLTKFDDRRTRLLAMSARALLDLWLSKLEDDPLYLLDAETTTWVRLELERLGRRFDLRDFE